MEYIDRHRMGCVGVGKILAMFQLRRSGGNMRYSYKCCRFPAASTCTNHQRYTSMYERLIVIAEFMHGCCGDDLCRSCP